MKNLLLTVLILVASLIQYNCTKKKKVTTIPIVERPIEQVVLPEPEIEIEYVEPEPIPVPTKINMAVFFTFDSYLLSDEAITVLNNIESSSNLKITGSTCTIGTEGYNYTLGLKRAKVVYDYLRLDDRSVCASDGEGNCQGNLNSCRNVRIETYDSSN